LVFSPVRSIFLARRRNEQDRWEEGNGRRVCWTWIQQLVPPISAAAFKFRKRGADPPKNCAANFRGSDLWAFPLLS
jgi:hypothetical protein